MRTVVKISLILGAVLLACGINRMMVNKKYSLGQQMSVELKAFNQWSIDYRRDYRTPEERNYRFKIFSENLMTIKRHSQTTSTYTLGLNSFADMTSEEFRAKLAGPFKSEELQRIQKAKIFNPKSSLGQVPVIDWRRYLQQQSISTTSRCNSNYAWVAAVNMNANYYIAHNIPSQYAFSPQTYIDCTENFGNHGCNGGSSMNCYTYSKFWGVDTLQNYPFYDSQKACTASTGYFKNTGIYTVSSLSNTELYNVLAAKKIITVFIDISGAQHYTGGIFSGPCTTTVNHALLLVGAGTDSATGKYYWNLMNTWGSGWGENGFMRIARFNVDGNPQYSSCGLNMYAHFPTFQ
jgi:Papain family cysteine protease/Cathepsin propeptide inhibitor domain (I29)